MTTAREIMESTVVTVRAEDSVIDTCRLFYREEISGGPVVDSTGKVVGVVSLTDLVGVAQQDHKRMIVDRSFYRGSEAETHPGWLAELEEIEDRFSSLRILDVMTCDVISVSPEAPLASIVKTVLDHRIHRVLVIEKRDDEEHLAGIISLFDLVSLLE